MDEFFIKYEQLDKHVESCMGSSLDTGSIPARSTIIFVRKDSDRQKSLKKF